MQLIFKVGNKYPIGHPLHFKGWRDGQLVTWLPDTAIIGTQVRKHFAVIQTPHSLIDLRGTDDIKAFTDQTKEFDRLFRVRDSAGRLPWDEFYSGEEVLHKRDYFVDYKGLLDSKLLTASLFDSLYDKSRDHELISLEGDFMKWMSLEEDKPRLVSEYSDRPGSISTGDHTIGDGLNFNTVDLFEAAIEATLTGALRGLHANEETACGSVVFAFKSSGHSFTLTAASGAEHSGGAYTTSKASINFGNWNYISFNEATDNDEADDIVISKLQFDIGGFENQAVSVNDAEEANFLVERCIFKGDSNCREAISIGELNTGSLIARNNIIYGGSASGRGGIRINSPFLNAAYSIYNNTIIGCDQGIRQDAASLSGSPTIVIKNNLCQNNTADFVDDGGGFGTTSKNISEDATGPDAAYDETDVHTNSVFKGYATDDFRLDSAGDATNLAIVDDGEDLSGTFTDDIQGQTRSTWYIGASEIVSGAPPVTTNAVFFGMNF